jgi:proteasome lid subunit RPN8/RPN11
MALKELQSSGEEDISAVECKHSGAAFSVSTGGQQVWNNQALSVIEPPLKCKVPQSVLIMMRTIEHHMRRKPQMGALEFGAFLKGKFENGCLMVGEDFSIVKQQVTGATIDFQEEPPPEFNGVIHRHPNGCKSFSGTDRASINQNYDFSLLYVDNNITIGVINLKIEGSRIQVPLTVEVLYPIYSVDTETLLQKIERKVDPAERLEVGKRFLPPHEGEPQFDFSDREGIEKFLTDSEREENGIAGEDDGEKGLDNIFESSKFDDIYCCDTCGHYQEIPRFPHKCESCDEILEDSDVTQVAELEPKDLGVDDQEAIMSAFQRANHQMADDVAG